MYISLINGSGILVGMIIHLSIRQQRKIEK